MAEATSPIHQPAPADSAAGPLPAGYRIHEYAIESTLGGGGFGITYLARDTNLELPVAIKEYFPSEVVERDAQLGVRVRPSDSQAQPGYDWGLERFLEEARALATFRHPNIVRVLRYFRANGTAYIVMEYESGQALKHWVPAHAPMTQRLLLSIIYPLLDGLAAVHKAGFLHRDIKPDNIYVRANGTPVLLDFGAATRITASEEPTNVASPGFAPVEQYHSGGNQGPWTDIYALGGVMYWMTTGRRPTEASERIANDPMLPASSLAAVSVYGHALLHAIEWAMQPEAAQRPQDVPLFRAAIEGSERTSPAGAGLDLATGRLLGSDFVHSQPASLQQTEGPAAATAQPAPGRRHLLCTVTVVDLVGYAALPEEEQLALKALLSVTVTNALQAVPEESRIAIDTGDGAAVCFLGDPEEALHSTLLLRDLMDQRPGERPAARIGMHLGPVRVMPEAGGPAQVVGDGINVARTVMDFAQPGQVLVSRGFHEVITRITEGSGQVFRALGAHEDRHSRVHELYVVEPQPNTAPAPPRLSTGYSRTMPVRQIWPLDAGAVRQVEAELARHIGPLAGVLARKAAPKARNIKALREMLAHSIQEPVARAWFVAGQKAPTTYEDPTSRTIPSDFASLGFAPKPESPWQDYIPPGEVAILADVLGRFTGKGASELLRREIYRNNSYDAVVVAVGATLDHPLQREAFLRAVQRALPGRLM